MPKTGISLIQEGSGAKVMPESDLIQFTILSEFSTMAEIARVRGTTSSISNPTDITSTAHQRLPRKKV